MVAIKISRDTAPNAALVLPPVLRLCSQKRAGCAGVVRKASCRLPVGDFEKRFVLWVVDHSKF